MRKRMVILLIGGVLVAVANGPAYGQSPTPPTCLLKVRSDYLGCLAQCRNDFTAARLACRNVNPACGEACLAGRQACLDQVQAILDTGTLPGGSPLADCTGGTHACKAAFQTARQACVDAACPAGQTCTYCEPSDQICTACVDQAQVTDFTCRDTCRDSWQTNAVVISMQESCRNGFQSCLAACPPNQ